MFAGQGKAEEVGEAYLVVEKVAEGILCLSSMMQGATPLRRRRYSHRYVMNLLGENADTRERHRFKSRNSSFTLYERQACSSEHKEPL